ncbi:putative orfan [Tupanvirus soda lake]|uniref:Orfan n=2 Tax=Tupanvirus TaxID=2094720 RepID=A0AC62ADZ6_9VIRU|nr:putative orfan [Tupanvirus soda lake]QKU35858.1 putative orfan [Tupanvirus soda lake]
MFEENNNKKTIKESILMVLVIILSYFLVLMYINNQFHTSRIEFQHKIEVQLMTFDFQSKINDIKRTCGVIYGIKINYLIVDSYMRNTTQNTTVLNLPEHPAVLTVGNFQQFLLKWANELFGSIEKMEMVTPMEDNDYHRTLNHWVKNPSEFQTKMHVAGLNDKYINTFNTFNTKTQQILTEWTVTFIKS